MFEVRCIVENNKLAETLRSLMPLTSEPPVVLPIQKQEDVKPIIKQGIFHKKKKRKKYIRNFAAQGNKTSHQIVRECIDNWKEETIRAKDMSRALEAAGFNARSYYFALVDLLKEGKLIKTDIEGTYKVNHG